MVTMPITIIVMVIMVMTITITIITITTTVMANLKIKCKYQNLVNVYYIQFAVVGFLIFVNIVVGLVVCLVIVLVKHVVNVYAYVVGFYCQVDKDSISFIFLSILYIFINISAYY